MRQQFFLKFTDKKEPKSVTILPIEITGNIMTGVEDDFMTNFGQSQKYAYDRDEIFL